MTELAGYRSRFTGIRAGLADEVDRSMLLIEELLNELDTTKSELKQTKLDLDNECHARRRLQLEVINGKDVIETQANRPFIVVLIDADADCYVFRDEFIGKGEKGGEAAADVLLGELQKFVRGLPGETNKMDIFVKAFANVEGLGRALQREGWVKFKDEIRAFTTGFNTRQVFFDFVDIGMGKERADTKIKENIKFFLESYQCKHLVLACGHDDGYAPWLGQFIGDKKVADGITLVECDPFPTKMRSLGLQTIKLDSVFGDGLKVPPPALKKIQSATPTTTTTTPASATTSAPPSALASPSASASAQGAASLASTWASTAAVSSNGSGSPNISVQTAKSASQRVKPEPGDYPGEVINPRWHEDWLGPLMFDDSGHRVDKQLKVNRVIQDRLRREPQHLCNMYYLRGYCKDTCPHSHEYPPLSHEEFDALWELSRRSRCTRTRKGPDYECMDENCIYGHPDSRERDFDSGGSRWRKDS